MTSIEWLENELKKSIYYHRIIEEIKSKSTIIQSNIFEQAKEMYNQEITEAHIYGQLLYSWQSENKKEI
jgi:hypothetical protein